MRSWFSPRPGSLRTQLNFPSEDLEGTGHARAGALYQEPLFDASTAPPGSAPIVNGFFPHLRWVFLSELISEALTRHKRLLESQIWWWRLVARS